RLIQHPVVPAKAGTHNHRRCLWVPALAALGRDDDPLVFAKHQPAAVGNDRGLRSPVSGLLFTGNAATSTCRAVSRAVRTTMRRHRGARQDLFLRSRISANTFHAGLPASPTDFATSGTSARRNGFAAFSAPMVDGMVGSCAARSLSTSVARARSAALSGSTVLAKATLALVYSWPQ